MSFFSQSGTFTSSGSTGNQVVSLDSGRWGGASPKCVLFWHSGSTSDGITAGSKIGFGAAISSSSRACVVTSSEDAQGTSDTDRRHDNTRCISVMNFAQTAIDEADFVSNGADQFTVDWTTAANAQIVNFLAIGGTDVSVFIDEISSPSSTGNVSYTGVGFQPNALVGFTIGHTTAPPGNTTYGIVSVGYSDGTDQAMSWMASDNAFSTSNTSRKQIAGFMGLSNDGAGPSEPFSECSVVSLDSDGYTLNWDPIGGAAGRFCWVVAIKAPKTKVLTATQGTSTGEKSTAVGFSPSCALFTTVMGVNSVSAANDARLGVGALDSSSNQSFSGAVDEDGQGTTDADRIQDSNEVLKMIDHAQSVKAAATGSLSGTSVVMNWTIADAVAREWGGVFFGPDVSRQFPNKMKRIMPHLGM